MWYLKAFMLLVLVVVMAVFVLANSDQVVVIRGWDAQASGTRINLGFALLGAYILGLVTFFVISAVRDWRWRGRVAGLRREMESMRRELDILRMAPLEDGPPAKFSGFRSGESKS